jgi:chromate transporter
MAETTPGPLIMVVQFVGFLAAYRHPGSCRRCWPEHSEALDLVHLRAVFSADQLGAPFIERLRTSHSTARWPDHGRRVGVILNLRSGSRCTPVPTPSVLGDLPVVDLPVLASADLWALGLSWPLWSRCSASTSAPPHAARLLAAGVPFSR